MIVREYEIVPGMFDCSLPLDARILSVQTKLDAPGKISMWVLCDPEMPQCSRRFAIQSTNQDFDFDYDYLHIGTYQLMIDGAASAYHMFELSPWTQEVPIERELIDALDE